MNPSYAGSDPLARRQGRLLHSMRHALKHLEEIEGGVVVLPDDPGTTAIPLIREIGQALGRAIDRLATLVLCGQIWQQLEQLDEFLDKHGDTLTQQQKDELNAAGEAIFEKGLRLGC